MAKSLSKVQKKVSKKKGAVEALHENSRDARKLRRAGARDDRVARVISATSKARESYVDRIVFFQENVQDASGPFTDGAMAELVQRYINRSLPEIEQLQSERRKGRPPIRREEALSQRTEAEDKEFRTGFWMPDLTQEDVLRHLVGWNGEWSGLGTMKFIRLAKGSTKQPSNFPPNGLS